MSSEIASPHKEGLLPVRYFENLSLSQVYGESRIVPGTSIVTDIPLGPYPDQFPTDKRGYEIMQEYGVTQFGGWSDWDLETSKRALVLEVGKGPHRTECASFWAERKLILDLSHALSAGQKPHILDVGCGNGFVAKLLAYKTQAKVTGVDLNLQAYGLLPDTPGDVNLFSGDIYDLGNPRK